MKALILLILLFAVSCGRTDSIGVSDTSLGQVRSISSLSIVSSLDQQNVNAICQALSQKSQILSFAVGSSHTFMTAQADCGGTGAGSSSQEVVIVSNNGNYVFKRKSDGLDYIFSDVETHTNGVIADLCSGGDDNVLSNPEVSGDRGTFFSTAVSRADCPAVAGETCLYIERGTVSQDRTQILINSQEWIRIRTNLSASKSGFFTYRKRFAKAFCSQGQFISTTATLQ